MDADEDEEITFVRSSVIEEHTEPRSIPRAIIERAAAPRHIEDAPTALNLPSDLPGSMPLTGEEDMRGFTRVERMLEGPGKARDPLPVARDPRLAFVEQHDKTSVIEPTPPTPPTPPPLLYRDPEPSYEPDGTKVLPGGGHPDYYADSTQLLEPNPIDDPDHPEVEATALLDMPGMDPDPIERPLADLRPRYPSPYQGPSGPAELPTRVDAGHLPPLPEPGPRPEPGPEEAAVVARAHGPSGGRRRPTGRRRPSGRQRPAGRGCPPDRASRTPADPGRPPYPGQARPAASVMTGPYPPAGTGRHPALGTGGYPPVGMGHPGTGRHPALGPAQTGRHVPVDENRRLAWGFLIGVVIAVSILAIGFVLGRYLLR